MVRGRAGTMTHDYKRNGTTDLFAALNVATGEVIAQCRKRHTGADVLAFFKLIDKQVPRSLAIHVVLDNLSAHTGPEVTAWLAHPRRARWHLHFTPTSSSWLNLVERWFKQLTDRRRRRDLHQRPGPDRRHHELGRTQQQRPQTLPLARQSRRHHRQGPPRPRHPLTSQIKDAALGREPNRTISTTALWDSHARLARAVSTGRRCGGANSRSACSVHPAYVRVAKPPAYRH